MKFTFLTETKHKIIKFVYWPCESSLIIFLAIISFLFFNHFPFLEVLNKYVGESESNIRYILYIVPILSIRRFEIHTKI